MFVAPDADLGDGQLDVVWTGAVGKLRFLANLPKVFKGAHVDNPEVTVRRASEVRIEADRPFAVYADGDHLADLPATVRVLPRALRGARARRVSAPLPNQGRGRQGDRRAQPPQRARRRHDPARPAAAADGP